MSTNDKKFKIYRLDVIKIEFMGNAITYASNQTESEMERKIEIVVN